MADDWQDLEFLRHVFDETQVVRKRSPGSSRAITCCPTSGRAGARSAGRSVEVAPHQGVARLVIGAGSGPTYGRCSTRRVMDQRLIARVSASLRLAGLARERGAQDSGAERDAPGHLERVSRTVAARVINTGVIATRTCASIPSRSTASSARSSIRVPRVARPGPDVVGLAVLAGALAWRSRGGR